MPRKNGNVIYDLSTVPQYGCAYWRMMDALYDTDPNSPLGHNSRCKDCK